MDLDVESVAVEMDTTHDDGERVMTISFRVTNHGESLHDIRIQSDASVKVCFESADAHDMHSALTHLEKDEKAYFSIWPYTPNMSAKFKIIARTQSGRTTIRGKLGSDAKLHLE